MSYYDKEGVVMNARITGVTLSTEDHGFLSSWIQVRHEHGSQGFGGYALYNLRFPTHDFGGRWIVRVMEIAGVSNWKDLVGKTIRVNACSSKIYTIGHIIEDKWFVPGAELKDE